MFIGETNIDGVTSFLFLINGKLGGYKIIDWHKYPLDNKVFDELKKLQLSSNNKAIEDGEYKVILDLNSGYKHYFKDNKEDLMMFYQMNGEDCTLYSGKGNNGSRRKIGKIIYNTYFAFSICVTLILGVNKVVQINKQKESEPINTTDYVTIYVVDGDEEIESSIQNNEILPLTVEEISNYVKSSSRLNDEEKAFLDNELLFTDFLPYINRNQYLIEKMRQQLYEIDIQCEEPGYDCTGISGYNNGTNTIYVVGYKEELFQEKKQTIAHEFSHIFHFNRQDFNYLQEATNELICCEYYDVPNSSYFDSVRIVKCLMEIIGVEPILEYHIIGDTAPLYNSLSPYLTEEEILQFTMDETYVDYTDEERKSRYEELKNALEKLYYGMYGESMWDNANIYAILNDLEYERYYFNSEKIKNTEMHSCTF